MLNKGVNTILWAVEMQKFSGNPPATIFKRHNMHPVQKTDTAAGSMVDSSKTVLTTICL
jgi:hypothetical protein